MWRRFKVGTREIEGRYGVMADGVHASVFLSILDGLEKEHARQEKSQKHGRHSNDNFMQAIHFGSAGRWLTGFCAFGSTRMGSHAVVVKKY